MPVGNFLMGGLLRSPLNRVLGRSFLLLTFAGQRTGKEYTVPLAFAHHGPDELVVLGRRPDGKGWWTNIRGSLPVRVKYGDRQSDGDASVVKGDDAVARLSSYLEKLPRLARSLGAATGADGRYERSSLEAVAAKVPVVSIKLRPSGGHR